MQVSFVCCLLSKGKDVEVTVFDHGLGQATGSRDYQISVPSVVLVLLVSNGPREPIFTKTVSILKNDGWVTRVSMISLRSLLKKDDSRTV